MPLNDLQKTMLHSFFVITTGIIASMFIFGLIVNPDVTFSLSDIGRVLKMALISDLTFIIFYSRKELNKNQMQIRRIIHFLVLLFLLLYFGQAWDWVEWNNPKEMLVYTALVIGVYTIVYAATAYQDRKLANKLNNGLKRRYHS